MHLLMIQQLATSLDELGAPQHLRQAVSNHVVRWRVHQFEDVGINFVLQPKISNANMFRVAKRTSALLRHRDRRHVILHQLIRALRESLLF